MATTLEICTRALRLIQVLAADEAAEASDYDIARDALQAEFALLKQNQGFAWTWTLDTAPDALLLPLAEVTASLIAPIYGVPGPSYARAVGRLRAYSFPDDRADRRDLDEDGAVSTAEIEADKKARYF